LVLEGLCDKGRPFNTIKGALSPWNADCPRSLILVLPPGPLAGGDMSKPATFPSSELTKFVERLVVISPTRTFSAE
jgi:hypothetical protein